MNAITAIQLFTEAVEAVKPASFMTKFLELEKDRLRIGEHWIEKSAFDRLFVLSLGKAASAMALEANGILGKLVHDALVITKEKHQLQALNWPQWEAGHPVPTAASVEAGKKVQQFVSRLSKNDCLLVLLSGGTSSLVADLPPGINLEELQGFYQTLLSSGASIDEMNTVRKHFSLLKGGQLVRHTNNALIHVGVLSDVPGDDLSVIASGPFYPDNSSFKDVNELIYRYGIADQLSIPIQDHLKQGLENLAMETPKPGDPVFHRVYHQLLATNSIAMNAAADAAIIRSYKPIVLQQSLDGEARETATKMISWCMKAAAAEINNDKAPIYCFIAGGETTVTLTGSGKGGRNQEFVLAAVHFLLTDAFAKTWLKEWEIVVLSGGTDGTDGPTDATGAVADEDILNKIKNDGPEPLPYLSNQDAYTYFSKLNALIITGPTQTNVMDLVIVLIKKRGLPK